MDSNNKGMVIIYTGGGKGKTTAALGLVLRAAGYKKKCLIVQFGKSWFTGELAAIKNLSPFVKIVQGGKGFVGILGDQKEELVHRKAADDTFKLLYKEVLSGEWDIAVADEIVGAVWAKMLPVEEVIKLINKKPHNLDLVLTGRNASQELIDMADLVTFMQEVKHPFQKGLTAKKGVDF